MYLETNNPDKISFPTNQKLHAELMQRHGGDAFTEAFELSTNEALFSQDAGLGGRRVKQLAVLFNLSPGENRGCA